MKSVMGAGDKMRVRSPPARGAWIEILSLAVLALI